MALVACFRRQRQKSRSRAANRRKTAPLTTKAIKVGVARAPAWATYDGPTVAKIQGQSVEISGGKGSLYYYSLLASPYSPHFCRSAFRHSLTLSRGSAASSDSGSSRTPSL